MCLVAAHAQKMDNHHLEKKLEESSLTTIGAQLQALPVHTRHAHSHPSPNFKVECGRFVFRRPNVHNHCAEPDPTLIWGLGLGKGTCASLVQVFFRRVDRMHRRHLPTSTLIRGPGEGTSTSLTLVSPEVASPTRREGGTQGDASNSSAKSSCCMGVETTLGFISHMLSTLTLKGRGGGGADCSLA